MKNLIVGSLALGLLFGCGSGDTSESEGSSGINLWDYMVPKESLSIVFDKITLLNNEVSTTENGLFTHEYTVVSDHEVNGAWRDKEGEYAIKLENDLLYYAPIESDPDYSWSSGSIQASRSEGDFIYRSTGDYGGSTTSGGTTSSLSVSGLDCVVNKVYDTITLYEGYSYADVLEIKCETSLNQKYGESDAPLIVHGVDRYYEYYQRDRGWIGKVNKDCIVAIGDDTFEFIDDNNGSCVQHRSEYILAQ